MLMEKQKIKVIYSLKMMNHLTQNGLQFIEIIQHPFKENFKAWVFEDTEELKRLMGEFKK